jgi:hypothetical protein
MRPCSLWLLLVVGRKVNLRTATSRQVNKDIPRVHHDALEFPDGTHILLTDLLEGSGGNCAPTSGTAAPSQQHHAAVAKPSSSAR